MTGMIASWHDFYVMAGGALAALTGLLFVAMSIHLREILAVRPLTRNVAIALFGMLGQLLFCGVMLAPGTTLAIAGAGVIVLGASFAAGYLMFGRPRNMWDRITNAGMGIAGAVLGVLMILGWEAALYLYAGIFGAAVVAMVTLCWRLLTMAITGLDGKRPASIVA